MVIFLPPNVCAEILFSLDLEYDSLIFVPGFKKGRVLLTANCHPSVCLPFHLVQSNSPKLIIKHYFTNLCATHQH